MWIDDQLLRRYREPVAIEIFVPEKPVVVLGSGNSVETEVDITSCEARGIPVTRRYGGGGTVVLYPGCVVISLGAWVKDPFNNSLYFKLLNQAVIDALAVEWPVMRQLSQSGISDVVCGDMKVAGTSLFRSRQYLLYQASLLVELDRPLVERCLKHPTKEPEYRRGRGHGSFLTSLCEIDPAIKNAAAVQCILQKNLGQALSQQLAEHFVMPVDTQMKALEERLARAEYLPSAF